MFFLWKNIDLFHMLDPIQYKFLFLLSTSADPEPKLPCSGSLHNTGPDPLLNFGSKLSFRQTENYLAFEDLDVSWASNMPIWKHTGTK